MGAFPKLNRTQVTQNHRWAPPPDHRPADLCQGAMAFVHIGSAGFEYAGINDIDDHEHE
jgi:hypothetical protein